MFSLLLLLFCPLLISCSERNLDYPLGGLKNVISIQSASNFCFFLPPKPGITIAESEGYPFASPEEASKFAISYCTQSNPNAPGAALFYDGFITGAHFRQTDKSIQVTGTINASAAGIPLDGGGYYDFDMNVNSPPGGICAGYDSFYNSVNPIDGLFCVICCKGISTCRIDLGEKGCDAIIEIVTGQRGDYSPVLQERLVGTGRSLNGPDSFPNTRGGNTGNRNTGNTENRNGTTSSSSDSVSPLTLKGFFISYLLFFLT